MFLVKGSFTVDSQTEDNQIFRIKYGLFRTSHMELEIIKI